jgi:hypothetical protein
MSASRLFASSSVDPGGRRLHPAAPMVAGGRELEFDKVLLLGRSLR